MMKIILSTEKDSTIPQTLPPCIFSDSMKRILKETVNICFAPKTDDSNLSENYQYTLVF